MHLLGCLFALVFGVFVIGAIFLGSIIDMIFSLLGIKKRVTRRNFSSYSERQSDYGPGQTGYGTRHDGYGQRQHGQQQQQSQGQQTRKIFEKDDSEYVDFEEV